MPASLQLIQRLRRRASFAVLAFALFVWANFGVMTSHAAVSASEVELKAVLLFRLTQFVTWPVESTNETEFIIGILGPDPFGEALQNVVQNEKVNGRPIRIVRQNRVRDLPHCALVYISPQSRTPLERVFTELNAQGVLTVGESAGFVEAGGMIRLKRTPERKVRLEIDLARAREKGFKFNAQLLRVSDVIEGGRP